MEELLVNTQTLSTPLTHRLLQASIAHLALSQMLTAFKPLPKEPL